MCRKEFLMWRMWAGSKSDHCMVSTKVSIVNKEPVKQVQRQNWAKANWAAMERDLGQVV